MLIVLSNILPGQKCHRQLPAHKVNDNRIKEFVEKHCEKIDKKVVNLFKFFYLKTDFKVKSKVIPKYVGPRRILNHQLDLFSGIIHENFGIKVSEYQVSQKKKLLLL